jgi:hypothetical protein
VDLDIMSKYGGGNGLPPGDEESLAEGVFAHADKRRSGNHRSKLSHELRVQSGYHCMPRKEVWGGLVPDGEDHRAFKQMMQDFITQMKFTAPS